MSAHPIPESDQVEATITQWVEEALELRHEAAGDPKGSINGVNPQTLDEVYDLLRRVRARSDRVDELLAKATQLRGRVRRAKEAADFNADRAVAEATQQRAARRVEFSSAKEREAEAKLDAFEQRRTLYFANRLVSITTDGYEVIRQVSSQLAEIRSDLRAHLRALQFESGLER